MRTTVANILTAEPGPDDVYVGRANPRRGLRGHPLANPFRIGPDQGRDQVLGRYQTWLLERPSLRDEIRPLIGKRLLCYCHPQPCHADLLAVLANMLTLLTTDEGSP